MKAIETVYKGYRFRSRLEARWAVFFDTLGIRWEYEKEGYQLDDMLLPDDITGEMCKLKGSWYLPDFWLPEQNLWVEIKGQEPTDEEIIKIKLLTAQSHARGIIVWGGIPENLEYKGWYEYRSGSYHDSDRQWGACEKCGRVDAVYCARADYICKCSDNRKSYGSDWIRIEEAFTTARQARFEHGEKG